MMYHAYQAHADLMWPLRTAARFTAPMLLDPAFDAFSFAGPASPRQIAAACKLLELAEITHERPAWGIASVVVDGEPMPVFEEAVHSTPFATLTRFSTPRSATQQKVLLVAPMSGHFATLLRDTVRTMLQGHEVYITDWHNVRDVPLAAGRFGLDEYTEHLMRFLEVIGPGAHLMAICQPCVSALSAVALMSEEGHPATPSSLTLMAGPIDCRINPTEVNKLATSRPIDWFERTLISHVPLGHRGAGRRVYPGFVQLTAFMSMNRERHATAFREYYQHLLDDEPEKAEVTRTFYEEYLAVSDLSADFYLETVRLVFQEHALPCGALTYRGRAIDPAAIRRTALLTIEGERDDICSIGQTLAAQDLAKSLRPHLRTHYVQPGVGHYGVFSGRRWQNQIYPMVRDVIQVSR
ncbi:MAG TPA: polyhydroxyalkanoate depolymerase [Burkholderiaceae bacterium]|nr:polyhydroxyalkanoate depolymerase [Burkholderiaceae bacterium]